VVGGTKSRCRNKVECSTIRGGVVQDPETGIRYMRDEARRSENSGRIFFTKGILCYAVALLSIDTVPLQRNVSVRPSFHPSRAV